LTRNSVAILVLVIAIMLDTLFSNISDTISSDVSPIDRVAIFSSIASAALVSGAYLVHNQTKKITDELGLKSRDLIWMLKTIRFVQYTIIGITILITAQMIATSQYSTLPLILLIGLGYLTGGLMSAVLSFKFLQWYRLNKLNVTLLLYLTSSSILSFMLISATIVQSIMITQANPNAVGANSVPEFPVLQGGTLDTVAAMLVISYLLTTIWLFLTWIASAIMLKRYSKRAGKRTPWHVILAPIVCMVIVMIPWFAAFQSSEPFSKDMAVYRMIGISAILAQGFLAGFAFLVVSRSMRASNIQSRIVQYIETSALGITLLFMSLPANIATGSFPPFGIISYSFTALASYLFLAGIYSSAISASLDSKLRQMIRKSLNDQSGLVGSIGLANLTQDLEKRVTSLVRKQKDMIKEETAIDSSITDTDVKNYIVEVMDEIRNRQAFAVDNNKQKDSNAGAAA